MSASARVGEEVGSGAGHPGPVTGTLPAHDRSRGMRRDRMGRSPALASRRDAVLRVLMEAYRRDVGPGAS